MQTVVLPDRLAGNTAQAKVYTLRITSSREIGISTDGEGWCVVVFAVEVMEQAHRHITGVEAGVICTGSTANAWIETDVQVRVRRKP